MKWLCILMLLGNIAYFGWELDKENQSINVSAASTLPPIPQTAKKLRFLSEFDAEPESNLISAPDDYEGNSNEELLGQQNIFNQSSDINLELKLGQLEFIKQLASEQLATEETICLSYGPISGEPKAIDLVNSLQEKNIKSFRRQAIAESNLYWVYLTSQSDSGEAEAVVNDLKQKGVTDYQLIKSGKFKNAISLGLFSSKERVDTRLKEINAKGYKPVVVPYHKPDLNRIYWVDVIFDKSSDDFENIISGIPSSYDSVPISCSKIALASESP